LESLLYKRGEVGDELPTPAGLHLNEQRLALVHAHPACEPDRLMAPLPRAALLIERVSGLMKHAHERAHEVCLAVAGCDPNVAGRSTTEWMQAYIEPPLVEIKSNGLHQLLADASLIVDREGTVEGLDGRKAILALLGLLN
jgi:hypothetical protein